MAHKTKRSIHRKRSVRKTRKQSVRKPKRSAKRNVRKTKRRSTRKVRKTKRRSTRKVRKPKRSVKSVRKRSVRKRSVRKRSVRKYKLKGGDDSDDFIEKLFNLRLNIESLTQDRNNLKQDLILLKNQFQKTYPESSLDYRQYEQDIQQMEQQINDLLCVEKSQEIRERKRFNQIKESVNKFGRNIKQSPQKIREGMRKGTRNFFKGIGGITETIKHAKHSGKLQRELGRTPEQRLDDLNINMNEIQPR